MTYTSGSLIQATDYNGFVSTNSGANLNNVLNTSYGQTAVPTVATGAVVTATQWATLNNSLTALAAHQNTTITSRTSPTAGNLIQVLAAMNTDLTAINNNVLNAYASGTQYTGWTGTTSLNSGYGSGQAAWTATFTHNVAFASVAAANYFFNAGGLIKLQFSKTSTGADADADWNAFANSQCGAIYFSVTGTGPKTIAGTSYSGTTVIGGTGAPTVATSIGYRQLTSSNQQLFLQYDANNPYTGNYIQVFALLSGSTITFTTYWHSAGDSNPGATANISGGSAPVGATPGTAATTIVTYLPPETTYLSNSWGTPTVTAAAG